MICLPENCSSQKSEIGGGINQFFISIFFYEGQRWNTYEHLDCNANRQGRQRIFNFGLNPRIPRKLMICLPENCSSQKSEIGGGINQK